MNFKQYLAEAAVAATKVNVTKFDIPELLSCYQNAGYILDRGDIAHFKDAVYNKFNSSTHSHSFFVLCQDEEQENWYITTLHVQLNKNGLLVAEPSGQPDFEGDEDTMTAKFASL